MIAMMRRVDLEPSAAINIIANLPGLFDAHVADELIKKLYPSVKDGSLVDVHDRSDLTRWALQHWGTEGRRSVDPDYWVRLAIADIKDRVRDQNVYLTDARFPNELQAVQQLGGYVIRLQVSEEVQAQRILDRDGVVITEDMKNHPSETMADDYDGFDLILDTDHATPEELSDTIMNFLRDQHERQDCEHADTRHEQHEES
jgi:phosphomevalonate kinase